MRGVVFAGPAKIRAELYRFRGRDYPGAVPTSRLRRFVYGELYRLEDPKKALRQIDALEGCDEGLFSRRLVNVWTNGRKKKAWSYFFAQPLEGAKPIPTGKYLDEHSAGAR